MNLRIFAAYCAALLLPLLLLGAFTHGAYALTVPNNSGTDDDDIQAVIDDVTDDGTIDDQVTVALNGYNGNLANCYTIDGPIFPKSSVKLDSADGATNPFCIRRASAPSPNAACDNAFDFFVVPEGVPRVRYFTMEDFYLDGRGPGKAPSKSLQECFVETGFNIRTRDAAGDSNFLTLRRGTFDHIYGTCTFTRYIYEFEWSDIDCVDPTKGGIIFSFGSNTGIVRNSSVTAAEDDALAFSSAHYQPLKQDPSNWALSGDVDVIGGSYRQAIDDDGCGTVCLRGATGIRFFDSITSALVIGKGSGAGALNIVEDGDPLDPYHSQNIIVNSALGSGANIVKIAGDENNHGVYIDETVMSNIQIKNATIDYDLGAPSGTCGIFLTARTNEAALTTSGLTFSPNVNASNICGD